MFSDKPNEAIGRFVQFLRETNSDVCLEIPEVKVNVSDDTLRQRVRQQFGIDAIKICNEMREKQDHILRVLKGIDGANMRQIARVRDYRRHGSGKLETKSLSLCFHDNSKTIDQTPGSEDNPYVNSNAKGFRLPTSNEWELVARYIDGKKWNSSGHVSGDITGNALGKYAWYKGNSGETTHIVGTAGSSTPSISKTGNANALGLYDISGNVWQWCFDWHPLYIGYRRIERGGSFGIERGLKLKMGFVDHDPPYYAYSRAGFRLAIPQ